MAQATDKTHETARNQCRDMIQRCVQNGITEAKDVPSGIQARFSAEFLRLMIDRGDVLMETAAGARFAEMLPQIAATGHVNGDATAALLDAIDEFVGPHLQRELDRAHAPADPVQAGRSNLPPSQRRLARLEQEGMA